MGLDGGPPRPGPSLILRFFGRLVAAEYRPEVLGDLEEEHRRLVSGDVGRLRASLWLVAHLIRSAVGSHWHGWIRRMISGRDDDGGGRLSMIEWVVQDVRYALRRFGRAPGFTAVVLLTLALGIGATVSIFSVVNGVLLRPLDYPESDRLVHLQGRPAALHAVSYPIFDFLEQRVAGLGDWSVWMGWGAFLRDEEGTPHPVFAASVSGDFFQSLGTSPAVGRLFGPEDDRPGHPPAVVLSHEAWKRYFGARPEVVGSTLTVSNTAYTVVGVVEPGFQDPIPLQFGSRVPSLWRTRPPSFDAAATASGWFAFWPMARLAPGVSASQAQLQVDQAVAELDPESAGRRPVAVVSLKEAQVREVRPTLMVLMATAVSVLLIVCANVANLLLSRASVRKQEVAVRASLGATRRRLLGQLLAESLLLAGAGTAIGLLAAWAALGPLLDLAGGGLPRADAVTLDLSVVLFGGLVAGGAALLFGLVPAFRLTGSGSLASLRQGTRSALSSRSAGRLQRALVVSETALAVILLVGAGLFARSLLNLLAVDPGFDPEPVLTAGVAIPEDFVPRGEAQTQVVARLLEELEATPGVVAAGAVTNLPMSGATNSTRILRQDLPEDDPARRLQTLVRAVAGDYFEAMSIPLVRGRLFGPGDVAGNPEVAVVNETFARRMFPDVDPLGRRVRVRGVDREVVGVVPDLIQFSLAGGGDPTLYTHYPQEREGWMRVGLTFVVASRGEAATLAPRVRDAVRRVDPNLAVGTVDPLSRLLEADVAEPRFRALLVLLFASVAVVLAAVGTAGVMAYAVSRRLPEMGLRLALGARQEDVLGLVVKEGLRLTLVGLGIGLVGALLSSQVVASFLFGVAPRDPLVFGGVAAFLGGVSMLASYLPARRAAAVDPASTLRAE